MERTIIPLFAFLSSASIRFMCRQNCTRDHVYMFLLLYDQMSPCRIMAVEASKLGRAVSCTQVAQFDTRQVIRISLRGTLCKEIVMNRLAKAIPLSCTGRLTNYLGMASDSKCRDRPLNSRPSNIVWQFPNTVPFSSLEPVIPPEKMKLG